jgi:hypothetical protein
MLWITPQSQGWMAPFLVNVCFWHKADITRLSSNVRYWGQSGHRVSRTECPLLTQSTPPFSPRYGSQLGRDIRRDYPMRRPLLTHQ